VSSLIVSSTATVSNTTAPTQHVTVGDNRYAYRQLGSGPGVPLLFLQHFTGTLDNWDPAVTDPLALGRSVILFESAGIGRSSGKVPTTVASMADHAMKFLDALGLTRVDVLGFSLGGMVAQVMALKRPALLRRIILTGTGPEGGVGVAMDRPELLKIFVDQKMPMSEKLVKLFFENTETSQSAGRQFVQRLARRTEDKDTPTTAEAAGAQLAAMAAWANSGGEPYTDLKKITQPILVTNGNNDTMIPTVNSFTLSEHLPNAQLIIYPDSGHGALFQHAGAFTSHVFEFLDRK
jgi:pimeloyl-ACP methyl ester carboxylesterase